MATIKALSKNNLILHIPCFENAGNICNDYSGNGHHATWHNTPSRTTGRLHTCVDLTGSNALIIGDISDLDFSNTDSFSISVWVKASGGGTSAVVGKMLSGSPYTGWDLWKNDSNNIAVHLINSWSGNAIKVISKGVNVWDGQWHHVVVTYDGSSSASGLRFYIDGSLSEITIDRNSLSSSVSTSARCIIGARDFGARFSGQVEELRIYSEVLNQNKVDLLYNYSFTKVKQDVDVSGSSVQAETFLRHNSRAIFQNGLIAHWTFDPTSHQQYKFHNIKANNVVREWWNNGGDASIDISLYNNPPDGYDFRNILEGPTNVSSNYTTRFRGYIEPPETGSYTFWCAGDDNTDLYLDTAGTDPSNITRLCYVPSWSSSREWDKHVSQKSSPVSLTAGTRYYIELRHAERSGGDNVAAGWAKPGESTTEPSEVIGETSGTLFPYIDAEISGGYIPSPGVLGQSIRLNNQYLTVPFNQLLNQATFTLCAWVKQDANSADYQAICYNADLINYSGYLFGVNTSGEWAISVGNGSSYVEVTNGSADSNWNFLVVTCNGSSVSLWVNGVQSGSTQVNYAPNTSEELYFGAGDAFGMRYYFNGRIDEIRMYDRILSSGEIAEMYKYGSKHV